MPENDTEATSEQQQQVTSVAATVLSSFFDELSKMDEFAESAANLRKLVLTDGVFAEPSVRAALFPDAP